MEREITVAKIKRDFKTIRDLPVTIETLTKTKERYEATILSEQSKGTSDSEKIQGLKNLIQSLGIPDLKKYLRELEERYVNVIVQLEPFEITMVMEVFYNRRTYKDIGYYMNYSERGVQAIMAKIFKKMIAILRKEH